jgi:hypothetical protein
VVDWDGLENRCACKRTVGSNPTLSAILLRAKRFVQNADGRMASKFAPLLYPLLAEARTL